MEQSKYMINGKAAAELLNSFFEKENTWEKLWAEAYAQTIT